MDRGRGWRGWWRWGWRGAPRWGRGGARGWRWGVGAKPRTVVIQHRHKGVYVIKGKEDILATING